MTTNQKKITAQGFVDALPLCVAVMPWGILCGSLGLQMGLDVWQAQAMSLFVFAGAVQLSGVAMLGAAAPLGSLLSSSFIISARHMLYSADMRRHITPLNLPWRLSLGFLLTDEMYALSVTHTNKTGVFSRLYALVTGLTFYIFWNLSTMFGILVGTKIEGLEHMGLEFAVAATFIALVVPTIQNRPTLATVIVSAVSMLLLRHANVAQALLIATALGMLTGFLLEGRQRGYPQ